MDHDEAIQHQCSSLNLGIKVLQALRQFHLKSSLQSGPVCLALDNQMLDLNPVGRRTSPSILGWSNAALAWIGLQLGKFASRKLIQELASFLIVTVDIGWGCPVAPRRFLMFQQLVGCGFHGAIHVTRRCRKEATLIRRVSQSPLKNPTAVRVVFSASSSREMPRRVARWRAVSATWAGSQRLPRCGTGAR